jgi:hypothetical protein
MLELTACGFDLGNGAPKTSMDNKASKIPNWHIGTEPKGALNSKTLLTAKPMAFPLEIDNNIHWFGQDTLSLAGHQEIDNDKLKPNYIKMMFKAVTWRWLDQHRVSSEWIADKRLSVVCGMPPELYLDRKARAEAEKVYRHVFNQNKPDYINVPGKPAIPFYTTFGGLKPETLSWRAVNKLKPGFTLLVDLGYGTSDFCMLHSDSELPVKITTLNNGLFHSHHEANAIEPWLSELDTMRGNLPNNPHHPIKRYSNTAKSKILQVVRPLASRKIALAQLVVFGGGVQLLDDITVKDLRSYADTVTLDKKRYNEFSNARWFEAIGRKMLEANEQN